MRPIRKARPLRVRSQMQADVTARRLEMVRVRRLWRIVAAKFEEQNGVPIHQLLAEVGVASAAAAEGTMEETWAVPSEASRARDGAAECEL
jgi:hypothetical protein